MDPVVILNIVKVAGFALVVIVVIAMILWEKLWVKMRGIKAEAVVIELVEHFTKGNYENKFVDTITYYPVIRYTTHQWEHITKKYSVAFKPGAFKTGDKLTIVYDKKKPDRFIVENFNKVL